MSKFAAWCADVASVDIASDLSLSCAPAGPCTAGAYFTGASGNQGFVTFGPMRRVSHRDA